MEKGADGQGADHAGHASAPDRVGDAAPTGRYWTTLHHKAHEACFIANSITTEIVIEPR